MPSLFENLSKFVFSAMGNHSLFQFHKKNPHVANLFEHFCSKKKSNLTFLYK